MRNLVFLVFLLPVLALAGSSSPLYRVTAPLTLDQGTIAIPAADANDDGYLTSEDWARFDAAAGGALTVGTFSASSQTNGANITDNVITFGPADATNPGMVSTGVQTFAGAKTFSGNLALSYGTASTVPYLDASKVLVSSSVTPTQLGYLSGATGTTGTGDLVFQDSPDFTTTVGITAPDSDHVVLSLFADSATGTVRQRFEGDSNNYFEWAADFGASNVLRLNANETTANTPLTIDRTNGTFTIGSYGFVLSNLTATTVPYLNANKALTSSSVTPTQLGYLSGTSGTTGTGSLVLGTSPSFGTSITVTAPDADETVADFRATSTGIARVRISNGTGNEYFALNGNFADTTLALAGVTGGAGNTVWTADRINGTFTISYDTIFNGETASTVPYLDSNKALVSSAVTPTQLGYLTGLTAGGFVSTSAGAGDAGKPIILNGSGQVDSSMLPAAGGDVSGPASSVNNGIPLFSGTGGKTLKSSAGEIKYTSGGGVGVSSFEVTGITGDNLDNTFRSQKHNRFFLRTPSNTWRNSIVWNNTSGGLYAFGTVNGGNQLYLAYNTETLGIGGSTIFRYNNIGALFLFENTEVRTPLLSPIANNTHDLGTSSLTWRDMYLTRDLYFYNDVAPDTGAATLANIPTAAGSTAQVGWIAIKVDGVTSYLPYWQ